MNMGLVFLEALLGRMQCLLNCCVCPTSLDQYMVWVGIPQGAAPCCRLTRKAAVHVVLASNGWGWMGEEWGGLRNAAAVYQVGVGHFDRFPKGTVQPEARAVRDQGCAVRSGLIHVLVQLVWLEIYYDTRLHVLVLSWSVGRRDSGVLIHPSKELTCCSWVKQFCFDALAKDLNQHKIHTGSCSSSVLQWLPTCTSIWYITTSACLHLL